MDNKKVGWTIGVLVLLVVVLMGFVIYAYGIQPAVSGYVVNAQNQGVQAAVVSIMQQAASCQQVPLTYQNQTINLIAVECLQQAQQQGQVQQSAGEVSTETEGSAQE